MESQRCVWSSHSHARFRSGHWRSDFAVHSSRTWLAYLIPHTLSRKVLLLSRVMNEKLRRRRLPSFSQVAVRKWPGQDGSSDSLAPGPVLVPPWTLVVTPHAVTALNSLQNSFGLLCCCDGSCPHFTGEGTVLRVLGLVKVTQTTRRGRGWSPDPGWHSRESAQQPLPALRQR